MHICLARDVVRTISSPENNAGLSRRPDDTDRFCTNIQIIPREEQYVTACLLLLCLCIHRWGSRWLSCMRDMSVIFPFSKSKPLLTVAYMSGVYLHAI